MAISWGDFTKGEAEQEQAPLSLWDLAAKKQQELGLTPGMEGTQTLYTGPILGIGSPKMSLSPFDGSQAFTFYTPPDGAFVSPLEGMERLYKQALGGEIQEEYVNPAFAGATGRDTTNYDFLAGLDPYKKDWGLGDTAYFAQKQKDWNFLDNVLKNPGMLFTMGALGGVLAAPASAAAAGGAGGAAVNDALGAFLMEVGELPAASAYGQAVLAGTPNWAIPGVSGAGGALGYTGALGTAVNDPLGAWLIEQGYPMDPTYAAEVTAGTPNWSIPGISGASEPSLWDKAKDLLDKKPPLPPAPGGGTGQMEGGGGGDGGDGMSIWSDTVNPYQFDPVGAYQPKYLQMQQQQFPFEAELQRRLALIRGAQ